MDAELTEDLLAHTLTWAQEHHDECVASYKYIFLEAPPDDQGIYVYTYYDANSFPLYHGYTTNARQRARDHMRKAPWASWADYVCYRKCSSPQQARRLETRLHRKVQSLCGNHAYHGEDWSAIELEHKINHVLGTCRLPGGACHPETIRQWLMAEIRSAT